MLNKRIKCVVKALFALGITLTFLKLVGASSLSWSATLAPIVVPISLAVVLFMLFLWAYPKK